MEVCPLATHNNVLSSKDVTGETEVLRSSLADPEHFVRHARGFAETFSPISNAAISDFISTIVCQSNERSVELSVSSQINTRTEPSIAEQDNYDNCACQEGDGSVKKSRFFCRDKLCTHWLDFIIVLMAAAGVADPGKTGGESEDKSADSSRRARRTKGKKSELLQSVFVENMEKRDEERWTV